MWTKEDLIQLNNKNITTEQVDKQLESFRRGFPFLKILLSASVDTGIKFIPEKEQSIYLDAWKRYLSGDKQIVKFVPASGAASRMFKDLFEFIEADYTIPSTPFEKQFFDQIEQFAFYAALDNACLNNQGKSINQLIEDGEYKAIVHNLLEKEGLNYGNLPKGLLYFHTYSNEVRTAMEEHFVEGVLYATNNKKQVELHFTVSAEHKPLFETLTKEITPKYESMFGVEYLIFFSEQKPSTDTIAVDKNNEPFREDGKILFRPGGHGALIENLNDISGDVIFIKNIDNVVPDDQKEPTVLYKQLIGGVLVSTQERIFEYLRLLDSEKINPKKYDRGQLEEILHFMEKELCIINPNAEKMNEEELAFYLESKLNRPIRVCGMVRNQGEPGGGPFLTYNMDGTVSPQILESSQIDMSDPVKKKLFEEGTHFNPVDLVCGIKDYQGNPFYLPSYVDKNTGFISIKSKNGRELKALELPGLWNGAMSDWNTIFVEVPVQTFNPVKMVNDLLRPEHQ
jgi:hypothetical protein